MRVEGMRRWLYLLVPVCFLFCSQPLMAQDDILDEIEAELKKEEEQKKAAAKADKNKEKFQANYSAAIRKGDALMRSKKYADAIAAYTEAKKWGPTEAYPDQQIALAKQEKERAEKAAKQAEIDTKYKGIITKADAYFSSKKYTEAIASYQEAAKTKPDEAYPKDQIGEAKKLLAEAEAAKKKAEEAAKLNKSFDEAMAAGDAAVKGKDFTTAIAKFDAAIKLKPDNAEAKSRKSTAEKMKADEEARLKQEKIKAEYDALIAEADQLLKSSQFDQAKGKYEAASKVLPEESYPKTKMKECDDAKLAAEKAKIRAEYDALLAEANALLSKEDFDGAIAKFNEAKGVLPQENDAQDGIKKAEQLKAQKAADALQAEFDALVKEGNDLVAADKFDEGIAKYKEANKKKPEETQTSSLIAQAEKLKKQKAEAATLAQYEAELKKGEDKMNAGDYDGAISIFEAAKSILPTDNRAADLVTKANELKADKAKQELQAQFNEKITSGESLLAEERYDEAIVAFEAAQKIISTDPKPAQLIQKAKDQRAAREKEMAKSEFDELVTKGDAALTSENFEEARTQYKAALAAYAEGQSTIDEKIKAVTAAEKAKQDAEAAAAAAKAEEEKFNSLMTEAKSNVSSGNLEMAKSKVTEALAIFPDNGEAKAKSAEIDQLIADAKKAEEERLQAEAAAKELAEKEKQVDALLAEASSAQSAENFDGAKAKIAAALAVLPDSEKAKSQEAELNAAIAAFEQKQAEEEAARLAAEKAEAEKKAKVEGLITEGDALFAKESFDEAIGKYDEALSVDPENSVAPAKKLEVQAAIEKKKQEELAAKTKAEQEAAEAERQQKIAGFMAAGATALSAGNFDEAKTNFDQVLVLDPQNTEAKGQLTAVEDARAKAEAEKLAADKAAADKAAAEEQAKLEEEKAAQIAGLSAEADAAESNEDFDGAIAKWKQVLAIDASAAGANEAITRIEGKKEQKAQAELAAAAAAKQAAEDAAKAEEAAQLQKQIDDLVAQAGTAESSGDLDGAITAWTSVKSLDASNSDASSNIDRLNNKKSEMAAAAAAAAEADRLKAEEEKRKQAALAQQQAEEEKLRKIETLSTEARSAESSGDISTAILKWKEVYALDPANSEASASISRLEQQQKKMEAEALAAAEAEKARLAAEAQAQAEEERKRLEAEKAEQINALITEAGAAESAEDYDKALEKYNQVLALDAGYSSALAGVDRVNLKKDKANAEALAAAEAKRKQEEAEAARKAAIEKQNLLKSYLSIGDQILAEKQYVKALENYRKANELDPGNPEIQSRISNAQKLKLEEDQRVASLEAKEKEQEIALLLSEARLLSIKREYKDAGEKYNKVLSYDPGNIDAKDGLASIQSFLDAIAKEEAEAERQRKLAEERRLKVEKILDEGSFLFAGGEYAKALDKYKEGIEIDPGNPELKAAIINTKQTMARAEQYRIAKAHGRPRPKPEGFKTETIGQTAERSDKKKFENELGKAYPEGVTEENSKEKRRDITRRIVVKEGMGTEYFRVRHDWGGVYYFKNGESITPYLWQYGTRSPDQIAN